MDVIKQAAQALKDETIATRRDFHQHPELAFEEVRTSGIIADKLESLGLTVRRDVGKTGVVGMLDSGKPGKTVIVRADIDALPIHAERDVPYKSQVDGKMHACGHDGHAAVALSTAKIFSDNKDLFSGKLAFIFQPAEEIVRGAEAMLADGALDGIHADATIGLHLSSDTPTGVVPVRAGPAMAAADSFKIVVHGHGGHAAKPNETVDPVVTSAQIITALQTLVSRETDPVKQTVISVTSIHGGTAFNIIPEAVELKGTLRTFDAAHREVMVERIKAVTKGIAETMRAHVDIDWRVGSPTVINDATMTERVRRVAAGVVGDDNVPTKDMIMGGDDMALWLQQAPGCYFFVGARNEAEGIDSPHHHPKFDIDENALPIAVEVLAKGALDFLSH
ncbi:MAG: amidohydrolase [Deinococcota bacterium]